MKQVGDFNTELVVEPPIALRKSVEDLHDLYETREKTNILLGLGFIASITLVVGLIIFKSGKA